jgi:hypothetical protein
MYWTPFRDSSIFGGYQLGSDSLPQDGVPKGEIRGPFTLPSNAYPGTQHSYWVYVPAQYDSAVPASLMNHAFDNYFGTFPGANGATMAHSPNPPPHDPNHTHKGWLNRATGAVRQQFVESDIPTYFA